MAEAQSYWNSSFFVSLRSREGVFVVIFALAALLSFLGFFERWFGPGLGDPFGYGTAFALVSLIIEIVRAKRQGQAQIAEQANKVVIAEKRVGAEESFPDFLKDQLRLASERGCLLMVRAEVRADWLFSIGTFLTLMSVVAPVVAIGVYASIEPLSETTRQALEDWGATRGTLPAGITVSVERDWHILLSGITFGFLFLAAAGAMFAQQRRQMETMLTVGRDVDYFKSLVGAIEIASRPDAADIRGGLRHVTGVVVSELLRRPTANGQATSEADSPQQLEQIMAMLRSIGPTK